VERCDTRAVRQSDLVELAAVVRDLRPERADRSRVALEAVDLATRKLGEEVERIATVVATDLENKGVVTASECVDLRL
jgi:hypothetical protein